MVAGILNTVTAFLMLSGALTAVTVTLCSKSKNEQYPEDVEQHRYISRWNDGKTGRKNTGRKGEKEGEEA